MARGTRFSRGPGRELLELGADGIHCSTSAHCRHLPNTHEEDFYGYSRPTVGRSGQNTASTSARPKSSTNRLGTI